VASIFWGVVRNGDFIIVIGVNDLTTMLFNFTRNPLEICGAKPW
jgi:hypothetical protein